MKQIKINSFQDIVLDDLEHIVFDLPAYSVSYNPLKPTINTINDLENYKFNKKYNLIYQNDSMTHACDFSETKKQSTDIIAKVLLENRDKIFMVIDHDKFDAFTLSQHSNCQVWPRKYFAPFHGWTHRGIRDESLIQKQRLHWFSSMLGRSDLYRSTVFNWIIDEGLDKSNKVSYLCYSSKTRDIDLHHDQQDNFVATNGKTEYKDLIPFNNFEIKRDIPADNFGRISKAMPLYDCLLNIIVETFATSHSAVHTEKSLNAILYGHVPVIISGKGTMKKLQDMGIIIPDYIQWSIWDDIPVDEHNYNKIHIVQRQLKKLFSEHSIDDIAKDWYPYAVRNFNKFNDLENSCALEELEICRWILTTTHNVSNKNYQYLYA